jgi:EmrB/QacA subfamily drug resistance transporter
MTAISSDARPGERELTTAGLIALLSGGVLSVMNAIIVNVAIPSIRNDFSASSAAIAAVVAYYGLAHGLMLITGGRLGDLFGRRRMFIAGLAAFTAASLLCGLATSIDMLVAARIAQGAAAAVMFPQVLSIIRVASANERKRARALAAFGVVLGLAAVVGQLIGGALIGSGIFGAASWRLVFLVSVPVGAAAGTAARLIPESRSATAKRLDIPGVFLCAAGLALVLYPLIAGRQGGWTGLTTVSLVAAVSVLAVFATDQRRKARENGSPLIDPGLFAIPSFSVGVAVAFLFHATLIATFFTLALVLQLGLNHSAFEAALISSPTGVAFLAASIVGNRLLDKFGTSVVLFLGGGISTIGYAACALIVIAQPLITGWHLVPALVATGFGQGLFLPSLLNAVLVNTSKEQAGAASGVVTTAQQIGGAFGVTVASIIYFDIAGDTLSTHVQAFSRTMAVQCALAIVMVCLLPLLSRHRDPKEMMT